MCEGSQEILYIHRCTTCGTSEGYAICASCVTGCHEGHEVKFVRRDRSRDNMKIGSLNPEQNRVGLDWTL